MKYILTLLAFILFLFFAAGFFVVLYATTRRDRSELFKPSTIAPSGRLKFRDQVIKGVQWIDAQEKENVSICSKDGLKLKGFLISPPLPRGVILAYHGFRSWPEREFAGMAEFLFSKGYAVLYPFQRSHRESEGKFITFGIKERHDCQLWANWISERFPDLPLWLYGQSMGGATVLMASGLKMPDKLRGVIADSAYNSPADVISNLLKRSYKIPAFPLILFIDFWTNVLAGYDLFRHSSVNCMSHDFPFLFIHGTEDSLIPYSMGRFNYENCQSKNKQFIKIPDSGHCACCYQNENEYKTSILLFLESTEALPKSSYSISK